MNSNRKAYWSAAAMPLIAFSTLLGAADRVECMLEDCCPPPQPPAPCYSIDGPCCCEYCLGPEAVAGNPAVRPKTCNGDFVITLAGFYWTAHQDGLAYAIETSTIANDNVFTTGTTPNPNFDSQANIIQGKYRNPHSHWRPGFKLGIGYDMVHDGWDIELIWTRYKGAGSAHCDTNASDNTSLLPLVSALQNPVPTQLWATDIEPHWKLHLDLVDLELGREFWNSKYLTLRPHIGLRYARLKQDYKVDLKGGTWGTQLPPQIPAPVFPALGTGPGQTGNVDMNNRFRGVGVRGGLDSVWHIGCGFSLFGNVAVALLYGRFHVDQSESTRQATSPFTKSPVLSSSDSFHSSKAATDTILGIQYSTMFCESRYAFTIGLGWEHHMFFNQNHLWRVTRVAQGLPTPSTATPATAFTTTTISGENVFNQRHGDLTTQGWTLNLCFQF